eukprot:GGOE01003694.1.p1 GENE.GGOE01003694.1~~GGOE01003694.1.p1  ORF type:complete len:164 (-),score=68.80 GGOE01003694.1:466-957(-)
MACKQKRSAANSQLSDLQEGNIIVADQYDPHSDPDFDAAVVDWMKAQLQKEVETIAAKGARCIPMAVKNCGVVREKPHVLVNRAEVNTGFDFDKVQRLMLSEPVPCPLKASYWYVNVLLFTDKPLPLILPYLYEKNGYNTLTEWVFINNNLARSRHSVDFAEA